MADANRKIEDLSFQVNILIEQVAALTSYISQFSSA